MKRVDDNEVQWNKIVDDVHAGDRLDVFWSVVLEGEGISRSKIQKWIRRGRAWVEGRICTKPNTRLGAGQQVRLDAESLQQGAAPRGGNLDMVYRDDDILVINKPAGLTVHPAPSVTGQTLVNILLYHFPHMASMDPERPGIVHRLDKDTSGLMMVAQNETARLALIKAFARREMDKEYLAMVHGVPAPSTGEIDYPIGRHPSIRTRMAVVDKGGRPARSTYKVVWASPDGCYSLVGVRIHTGRTHQVRVHMARIGHPLVGDGVYALGHTSPSVNAALLDRVVDRQMLHAWRLGFVHPTTKKRCSFVKEPPRDMVRALVLASRRPQHVGLTGMSGSGKSTVLAAFAGLGVPVWSADACVARLYAPGGDGWEVMRARFGERFVPCATAPVDKGKLFRAMCSDPGLRREIEAMIHPMVQWDLERFLDEHAHARMTVSEVPLLMESGWHHRDLFDHILGIFCPDSLRASRLKDRGWSDETMSLVDSWQWSQGDKLAKCDLIIANDAGRTRLESRVARAACLLRSWRRKRVRAWWQWLDGFVHTGWE
ncbi:dephospho-CoA kinase [Desulfoplanes formicivorans]|uniref:Dephospho-CoA kinase n=1 Tax=Desulfoplanes formicivorans TaxID=1592317 RepID=A0A194AG33_9BACT|nr:dephospho-CoA kinase [Desulfoplanes formicivorans]GAU09037.1 dephospho-CoA kinase [Desulfoplanes formicivorans]